MSAHWGATCVGGLLGGDQRCCEWRGPERHHEAAPTPKTRTGWTSCARRGLPVWRLGGKIEHSRFQLKCLSPMGRDPPAHGRRAMERWPYGLCVELGDGIMNTDTE